MYSAPSSGMFGVQRSQFQKNEFAADSCRRLLDAQLAEMIENPGSGAVDMSGHEEVVKAMMALLQKDGLSVG